MSGAYLISIAYYLFFISIAFFYIIGKAIPMNTHNIGKENYPLMEPRCEKTCFMPCANNTDADQPAHPRSLISTFIVHCLDSIIPLVSISEILRLYLAFVAEQAGLSLTWVQTQRQVF